MLQQITMNRADMLQRLTAEPAGWDVLVIGGGATGLGTAVDAAARGYRTVLVEQADFAQCTSSRSSKLIHGGIRYLQQCRFGLVRESLHERHRLLHNAPHLVHPLPFILPNYAWWERGYYGTGLWLYDRLGGETGVEPARHLSRTATLQRIPTLKPEGLRGGILYYDGQFDDARLAIALARTAADLGSVVINYVKVVEIVKRNDRVTGARVLDLESGTELTVHARVVINATGVFADSVRHLDDVSKPDLLTTSQGAHLVLDKSFLQGSCALAAPRTADGRIFFAIPWHERVLIGTTETAVSSIEAEPRPLRSEVEFLLNHAAQHLTRAPSTSDILGAFAGLRPLLKRPDGRPTSTLPRSHLVEVAQSGLVTVTGGKWTTYRQMAEDAVTRAAEVGKLPVRETRTKDLQLHGAQQGVVYNGHFASYGDDALAVQALCNGQDSRLLHPELPYLAGEVQWSVRHEMARTIADVLSRRMRALLLNTRASMAIAPEVAGIMAAELKRDGAWIEQQVKSFCELAHGSLFP